MRISVSSTLSLEVENTYSFGVSAAGTAIGRVAESPLRGGRRRPRCTTIRGHSHITRSLTLHCTPPQCPL
ncbi:unnamed protein product [Pieris brassicae]|uniref:Uncharacterized protein n=1 Tax=Pieris brassicae TaxID=7116 RepID=A0A9P0XHB3_PIEBR|nr:unnamed protein product [Pieris brassicae]